MIEIIVEFFTGFEGWGVIFAIILILALLGTAFSGVPEAVPVNSFFSLHQSSTFDYDVKDIGTYFDRNKNMYTDALYFEYGRSSEKDVYQLDGNYTSFGGTVFVPENRNNNEHCGQVFIYGDGKRLWTSPQMGYESSPEDFAINVTNVNALSIRYLGGASTWPVSIGIGNISIGTDNVDAPMPSQLPTRLLDLPLKESTFGGYSWRYTDSCDVFEDHFGNNYKDSMTYLSGYEECKDVYEIDGQYSCLSGTIYIPSDRKTDADNQCPDEMFYVRIYGDEKLLYTSPQMVNMQSPAYFNVNIAGCNELTITFYGNGEVNLDSLLLS